jgi:glycosyltransferase involved in cell wall biosynthesis
LKSIRVLFVNRPSAFTVPGGDTVQMIGTADALKRLGVEVDIYTESTTVDYDQYDVIHFFNISRPDPILYHLERTHKPAVLSTIYIDNSYYRNVEVRLWVKWASKLLGRHGIEYGKALYKHIKGTERLKSKYYLRHGQRKSIDKILKRVDCLLPNSASEAQRLRDDFDREMTIAVVYNGVDLHRFPEGLPQHKNKNMVLCAARIEPMKNQYNAILALNNTSFHLYLAGAPAPNHLKYYQQCKAIAGPNIHFLGAMPQEALFAYYQEAAIHILPSRFETTGLSSLEAAYMGCEIVVSNMGDTLDYFKNYAVFCDPEKPQSILESVEQARKQQLSNGLREKIIKDYNWDAIAAKLLPIYSSVIKHERI